MKLSGIIRGELSVTETLGVLAGVGSMYLGSRHIWVLALVEAIVSLAERVVPVNGVVGCCHGTVVFLERE